MSESRKWAFGLPEPTTERDLVARDGFALVRRALASDRVEELRASVEHAVRQMRPRDSGAISSRGIVYALRGIDRLLPRLRDLIEVASIASPLSEILGDGVVLIRVILFDKHPSIRWTLPWHRDVVFGVRGEPRWRAPQATLERMLAVRFHLDDADEANGCLQVVRGSHAASSDLTASSPAPPPATDVVPVVASGGDALLMRPLLLHRSARATDPTRHRRVLHFDLAAAGALPPGLSGP